MQDRNEPPVWEEIPRRLAVALASSPTVAKRARQIAIENGRDPKKHQVIDADWRQATSEALQEAIEDWLAKEKERWR